MTGKRRALVAIATLFVSITHAGASHAGPYGIPPVDLKLDWSPLSIGPTLGGAGLLDRDGAGGTLEGGVALAIYDGSRPGYCFGTGVEARPTSHPSYVEWTSAGGFGLGPVSFGGGVGIAFGDGDRPQKLTGFVLGPELILHLRARLGDWRPVLQVFLRGEATVLGRDRVSDRGLLGARILFDIPH